MECIVHYQNQACYSSLKSLSDRNIARIKEAKAKRLELGGSHCHSEQSDSIPDDINLETHGVHLEPCYKRYLNFFFQQRFYGKILNTKVRIIITRDNDN